MTEAAAHPFFARWSVDGDAITIEVPDVPAPTARVTYLPRLEHSGARYWELGLEDGSAFRRLHERDVAALEAAFGRKRIELPGSVPPADVGATLMRARARAVARLAPALTRAMAEAARAGSNDALVSLARSEPGVDAAFGWLADAVVRHRDGVTEWNESAIAALKTLSPDGWRLEHEAWPDTTGTGLGGCGLVVILVAPEPDVEASIVIDSVGRLAVREGEHWRLVACAADPETELAEALRDAEEAMSFGRTDDAVAAWRRALAIAPDHPEVHLELGRERLEGGDPAGAAEHLARATKDPAFAGDAWFTLAMAQLQLGEDPVPAFEAAVEHLDGENRVRAVVNLCLLSADREAAIERLATFLEAEAPGSAEGWRTLGLMQVKAGRLDDCIASCERSLALEDDATTRYTVACAHALRSATGDREKAIEHVRHAVGADPSLAADIAEDEDFASLRDDPGFAAALRGQALPSA